MSDLFWRRLVANIDHPHRDDIPCLAIHPAPWPKRFQTPWLWTGGKSNRTPFIRFDGRPQTVQRVLYHLLIEPVGPDVLIRPALNRLDVNPLHCRKRFARRDVFPPLSPEPTDAPTESPDFLSPEEIADLQDVIEGRDPTSVEAIADLIREYGSRTVFECLHRARLLYQLDINSEEDLKSDSSAPPDGDSLNVRLAFISP